MTDIFNAKPIPRCLALHLTNPYYFNDNKISHLEGRTPNFVHFPETNKLGQLVSHGNGIRFMQFIKSNTQNTLNLYCLARWICPLLIEVRRKVAVGKRQKLNFLLCSWKLSRNSTQMVWGPLARRWKKRWKEPN